MMSLTKRFVSLLMALVLVLSTLPASAFAAEEIAIEDLVEITIEAEEGAQSAPASEDTEEIPIEVEMIPVDADQPASEPAEDIPDAGLTELEIMDVPAEETEEEVVEELETEEESVAGMASIPMLLSSTNTLTYFIQDEAVSITSNSGGYFDLVDYAWFDEEAEEYSAWAPWDRRGNYYPHTITIQNETDKKAKFSFQYVSELCGTLTIGGASVSESGTYELTLDAMSNTSTRDELVIELRAGDFDDDASLILSNFAFEPLAEATEVAFVHDANLGSVSYTAEDASGSMANGTLMQVSTSTGITLTATPVAGARFLGWISENDAYAAGTVDADTDGAILSTQSTFTYIPTGSITVKAVFIAETDTNPWIMVGGTIAHPFTGVMGMDSNYYNVSGTHIYDSFEAAATAAAQSTTSKAMVLLNNAVLPAGTHTIPAGTSLLIPYDDANTMYTVGAMYCDENSYQTPRAYRTLTFASGAELIVNGAMSVSGIHRYVNGGALNGAGPSGDLGFVKMQSGSKITVKNGGALYAYGYITGSGSVTVDSGACVYELFQIADFRGGTQTTEMENGVFPLSQYYVQNIEVPMTIMAGATEYSYTTVNMGSIGIIAGSSVGFIGSKNTMFNMTDGYVTKYYDGATDRLMVEATGTMSMSPIVMALGGAYDLDSADYELPINANITVKINSGSNITIKQDISMLPGAQIIIEEGAKCTLGAGNNVYVYDVDQWDTYCGSGNKKFIPVYYAPGRTGSRSLTDASILVNGTMDASQGHIYTTKSGANIYSTGNGTALVNPGDEAYTYQLIQNSNAELADTYVQIPITPAKLKNADGSFFSTDTDSYRDGLSYVYKNGVWDCAHIYPTVPSTSTDPTCTEDGVKTYVCTWCGHTKTEVTAKLGHKEAITEGKAATCTETGLTAKSTCSDCHEVLEDHQVIPATNHKDREVLPAVEPTCTEPGKKAGEKCKTCGVIVTPQETVEATGHTEETIPGVAATCSATGLTEGKKCSVCGEILTAQKPTAALGHSEVTLPAVPSTCTVKGKTEGTECERCHTIIVPQDELPLASHTIETLPAVAAKCESTGLTEGEKCSVCGEVLKAQEVIPVLGHTERIVAGKAATCTATGLTDGKDCSVCGKVLLEQEVIDVIPHTPETIPAVAATCTKTGLTAGEKCSACGEMLKAQETVPVIPHSEEVLAAKDATCSATGLTEGKQCTACGTITVEQTVVPATGHSTKVLEAKAPTCTETGLTEGEQCTVCDVITVKQEIVNALGHSEGDLEAKLPSCTETGLTAGKQCTVCDTITVKQEIVPATGHTKTQELAAKAPSCTETGLGVGVKCLICNTVIEPQAVIPALGHTAEPIAAVAPSCTETGLTAGEKCSVCGDITVAQEVVAATGHNDIEILAAVAPTCTETGLTAGEKCRTCSTVIKPQEEVEALGHTEESIAAVAPSCTETGLSAGSKCTVCGTITVKQEIVSATGHTEKTVEAQAPTCTETGLTEGKVCSVCDAVLTPQSVVKETGHNWGEGEITTQPTCLDEGVRTYTCANNCGETKTAVEEAMGHNWVHTDEIPATCTEEGSSSGSECTRCGATQGASAIPALGHNWVDGDISTAPTCTEKGVREILCDRDGCDATSTKEVDATGHTEVIDPMEQPSCSATGLSQGSHCSVCNKVINEQTVLEKLAHIPTGIAAVDPGCTEPGKTAGKMCSVCEEILEAPQEVPATGHTTVKDAAKDPTCTETGLTEGTHCSVCDEVFVKQEIVPSTGHTTVKDAAKDPTCTETGLTEGSHCSVCGEVFVKQEIVPSTGHTTVKDAAKEPTCTEDGLTEGSHCSVCGEVFVKQETVPSTGHTVVVDKAVAATCTTPGKTAGSHCSVCKETLVAQQDTALADHTVIVDPAVAPTCTETGKTEGSHCAVCKEELKKQEIVDSLGHTVVVDEAVASTCTKAGLTEGSHCSVCKEVLVAQKEAALAPHTAVVDAAVASTCTKAGLTEGSHCSVCNETLVAQKEAALAPHTEVKDAAVVPTCTATGLTEGAHCSVCNHVIKEQTVVAVVDHTPVKDAAVAPTCSATGKTEGSHCSVCKTVLVAQTTVAATGHTVVNDPAVAATCTKEGKTSGTHCSVCNTVIIPQKVVAAKGHTAMTDAAVAPTCTETGLTEGSHCSVCNEVLAKQTVVASKGHTEVKDAAVEATCTETGLTEGSHCSVCKEVLVKQTVVASKGHAKEALAAVEPSCSEKGKTAGEGCSVCGEILVAQEEIAALGHDWKDGEITLQPTCTAAGERNVSCQREGCSATDTAPVASLGHDWVDAGIKAAPTCIMTGMKNIECQREGCTEIGFETIPALGHTEVADAAKAPTCTETGLTAGSHCSVCKAALVAQQEIAALGHTVVVDAAVEPDCVSKTGLTEGSHCSVCNEVLLKQEVIPAGHKFDVYPCKQAPATCQRCGYVVSEVVPHDLSAATCTEAAFCLYGCGYESDGALGHTEVIDEEIPAMCEESGLTEGSHCSVCGEILVAQKEIAPLGHDIEKFDYKKPTYTSVGWEAYEACSRCSYSTYVEIPMLEGALIEDYATFLNYLPMLEELADEYVKSNPGKDPLALVIKYIRTGVDRYNSGSWGIMAGYEDTGFADYVSQVEDSINATAEDESQMIIISGLKNIELFEAPNGDEVDLGHMFGTMDITYHNYGSLNHADVGGWAGDIVDLMSTADRHSVTGSLEEMVAEITDKYLCQPLDEQDIFSLKDMYGDLDGYYIMQQLNPKTYSAGQLTEIIEAYFVNTLTDFDRAEYFLKNRLDGASTRSEVRNAVYNAFTSNKMAATLEGTYDFIATDLSDVRKASCYAFADYICKLAGDYVNIVHNPYYTVFSGESVTLAPGITQQINYATSADGKQMVYYLATGDLTREDVQVYANYKDNDPSQGWGMQRVLDQANAAQARHSDPADEQNYIENYNVIASVNGGGYNMQTGEPSGLLVMEGVEYHPINSSGFFAILKDGTAKIGTTAEWSTYKDQIQEAIAGFGTTLVRNGELAITATSNYYSDRASRTAVGITKTGKIVFMVLDGRQEPFSCGGSMIEIAQIMQEAGCIEAINLDGGGSTTYVAKQPGDEELSVVSRPSDGAARSVSTSLLMVSTAPSSTAFDHAVLETDKDYMTIGTSIQVNAAGVSATGNAVEVPEGATWSVSNDKWATITEDGMLTALRNGSVDVYLNLDGEVIGSMTMNIVVPEQIYFTRSNIDAVYGATVALPIKALYNNKEVAIHDSDIVFTLSNAAAGTIEGFNFIGTEGTGLKSIKITAALASNTAVTATINVALYNQGEASFDFDQATGGSRILAWDRQVSNAVTDDGVTYTVVDMDKDMVTSYIIAMDMSEIPIPKKLEDLTYMLPGADMEGASAWTFLLQLAERISVLTEVNAKITFDPNVDVDYSGLTLVNEYFELKEKVFDAASNTLTLRLNWIDQTQPINADEAKPLCIVSGIKLTPKADAPWDEKDRLTMVHTGDISYKIYMRASGLYSFAQKPENQKTFGLYPFVNPNDESEKGGWFGDTYTTFEDSYNLVNVSMNGWVNEEGGYAYYVNGVKLTGVKEVDGYYYDFGTNGINIGQTKYNGLFYDEAVRAYRYSYLGELASDWQMIGDNWYYFHASTMTAAKGRVKVGAVYFSFEETGRLISGEWVNTQKGTCYYEGPSMSWRGWEEVDGKWYFFSDGYCLKGNQKVQSRDNAAIQKLYDFGDDGALRGELDGLCVIDGKWYYAVNGAQRVGLHKIEDDYYFFKYGGGVVTNETMYAWETHCDLPCDNYFFDAEGRLANGFFEKTDGIYYYEKGKPSGGRVGLDKIGDDYYFLSYSGRLVTGEEYVWATNCDLPCGTYIFGKDGKMLRGVVKTDEGYFLYNNGSIVKNKAGLVKVDDAYYYVDSTGKCLTGSVKCAVTYCDLPIGTYEFGADGKMLNGFVETENGGYYYENGVAGGNKVGLSKIGEDYYFIGSDGKYAVGEQYLDNLTDDFHRGSYEFGADGKLLDGIVATENGYYYYENGKPGGSKIGLSKVGEDYYLIDYTGKCEVGKQYAWKSTCNLPRGYYEFGADGKMLQGMVEMSNGSYYYKNGNRSGSQPGLTKIGNAYYFIDYTGKCVTGKYYAWKTLCDLPCGSYIFDADGKMLDGFVTREDGIYYYIDGKVAPKGVHYVGGYYYYVINNAGKLVTSQTFQVVDVDNKLRAGNYTFNAFGQII